MQPMEADSKAPAEGGASEHHPAAPAVDWKGNSLLLRICIHMCAHSQ